MCAKLFVATLQFCNWYCEPLYNGELDCLITYSADDITEMDP